MCNIRGVHNPIKSMSIEELEAELAERRLATDLELASRCVPELYSHMDALANTIARYQQTKDNMWRITQ